MPVSPETEIAAAYAAGRAAAGVRLLITANPFDGSTTLSAQQRSAWAQGWLDQNKDLTNNVLAGGLLPYAPLQTASIILASAQVNALAATFPTLVAAQPGVAYIPTWLAVQKAAGTLYTTSGQIGVRHSLVGFYVGLDIANLLDQAAAKARYRSPPTFAGPGDELLQYAGSALQVMNSAAISGGVGNVTVTVQFLTFSTS